MMILKSKIHHESIKELYAIWDSLPTWDTFTSRIIESWHDAQQIREDSEILDLERLTLDS